MAFVLAFFERLMFFSHVISSCLGSEDYSKLILESHLDLLDILHAFPSCNPPLSRLVGRLQLQVHLS